MDELVGLRLPDELYRAVAEKAQAQGNSLQSVIRAILAEYFNDTDRQEQAKEGKEPVSVQ